MDDVLRKATDYLTYCINKDNAHYLTAERALRWHNRLGIPAVIATTVVATSLFAALEHEPAFGWKLATGIVSLAAVVFAGLQTFLNFSERAQKHVTAAIGYSQVRRQLEQFLLRYQPAPATQRDAALADLAKIVNGLDELDNLSLLIPTRIYEQARAQSWRFEPEHSQQPLAGTVAGRWSPRRWLGRRRTHAARS